MKKLLFGAILLALVIVVPLQTMGQVGISINIGLPPPIAFAAPPLMVVLPDTDVYVAPDYDQDIYFYGGWWWRPWGGRWYRSLNYDSGWEFYYGVPGWYGEVYPHWRNNYRNHMWGGQRWDYRSVPYGDVRTNWKSWQSSGHWRNQQNRATTGSYRQGVETRRNFRGFEQETKVRQAPVVAARQAPVVASRQAPVVTARHAPVVAARHAPVVAARQAPVVATRQAPDLSKNKSAFAGVERGSDVRIQSNRGLQSRQSMPSKGAGSVNKGSVDRHR
jgi:hypothetical protein